MFCLPLFLIPSKGTSQFLVQFVHRSSVSSRFISFVIPPKNMIHSMPPNCLLSNLLHSHCFQIQCTAYRSGLCIKASIFCAFKASRTCVFPSSCHFVQKDKNKLFISTHSVKQDGRVNPATKQSILIDLSANFTCVGLDNQVWDM